VELITARLDVLRYPNRYTVRAGDVLPLLENGGIQSPGWMGEIKVHAERVAACPADLILSIDAWDQS
jgi:hypothetical protein